MKKLARVLAIMFVCIVIIGINVYANTASVSLSASNTQIEAGSTATVSVVASGSGQIRGGEFNASISSSDFEIVSVTGAGIFSVSGSGGSYLVYNMSGASAPSGSTIAIITVRAKAGAGATGTLNVTGAGVVFEGDESNTVSAGSSSRAFTVKDSSSGTPSNPTNGGSTTNNNTTTKDKDEKKTKEEEEKLKANADLASLTSEVVKIPFNKNTLEYTINVDKTVKSLGLKAVAENSKAKVTITGDENFKTGNNVITIKIVSEDGKTTKTYTITVVKSKYGSGALSSLKIDKFKLSPKFDPSVLEYKVTIDGASDATALVLKYTATNSDAKITVEGNENFVVGKNMVTITVTDPDGKVTVYKIEVIKESPALDKLNDISKKNNSIWLTIVIVLSVLVVGEAVYIVIKKIKENKRK